MTADSRGNQSEERVSYGSMDPPLLPPYEISSDLRRYTFYFIIAIFINFIIAGSLAIVMRFIQNDIPIAGHVDTPAQNILFYSLLTAHGQVMFFGVASMLTMFFGYYAVSKWARKPLSAMKWVKISFWMMEAAVVLIFLSCYFGFGAGWYNLMPLTFMAGRILAWSVTSAFIFLVGDFLVGISLSIFCLVILVTLLKGKLPIGAQKLEVIYDEAEEKGFPKEIFQNYVDHTKFETLPAALRWVSLLGISSWFPKKLRIKVPAVPIILVAAFVTALVQLSGNPGLFLQLINGVQAIQNPSISINWLLTKDAWWFFAHPIVYFVLLLSLGAAYALIPRYGKEPISYSKWNYRAWPFYLVFSTLVFSHHLFMDLPNPVWLQMLSQTASLAIIFPSGLTIITILMHIWRGHVSWNLTTRFLLAGILGWAFGGFQGAETGMWGADLYQHNTMALPGHIHLIVLMGPVLMGFGLIYVVLEDLTKKKLSRTLGEIHFWLTIFGGFGFALLFTLLGMEGAVRREANMPLPFDWAMPLLLFFALCIGIAQLVFAYNLMHTFKKKRNAGDELPQREETALIQNENKTSNHISNEEMIESNKKKSTL